MSRTPLLAWTLALLAACGGGGGGGGPNGDPGGPGPGPDPTPATELQQYTLDRLNDYRFLAGSDPLVLDAQLNAFAQEGSEELAQTHVPHGHFNRARLAGTLFTTDGFEGSAGENQGDPLGWRPRASVEDQIDEILEAMFDEGPGPGPIENHYDNMVNPSFERLGVGLFLDSGGRLYFTNDFSG